MFLVLMSTLGSKISPLFFRWCLSELARAVMEAPLALNTGGSQPDGPHVPHPNDQVREERSASLFIHGRLIIHFDPIYFPDMLLYSQGTFLTDFWFVIVLYCTCPYSLLFSLFPALLCLPRSFWILMLLYGYGYPLRDVWEHHFCPLTQVHAGLTKIYFYPSKHQWKNLKGEFHLQLQKTA